MRQELDKLYTDFRAIRPSDNVLICNANPYYNMQIFTINGSCVLRSVLGDGYYVDLAIDTRGIQYTYVVKGATYKNGYLVQF